MNPPEAVEDTIVNSPLIRVLQEKDPEISPEGLTLPRKYQTAYRSEVRQNKEATAMLSLKFGFNWNSLDYGTREQGAPNRLSSQSKRLDKRR